VSSFKAVEVYRQYGKKLVVRGVSLDIRRGEIAGLLGPNGAGKTTTFYMLVGIISPTRGRVIFDNEDITNLSLPRRSGLGISYLPQESSIFKKLTVYENLMLILEYTHSSRHEQKTRAQELMKELGISKLAHQKASFLSGGERRRLEIARALIKNPKFILLDEPFAGIDPLAVDDIQNIILKLKEKNIGILISDHNVRETLTICDRASIVYDGQVILDGTPAEIIADTRARSVYLGESFRL
jgi:lipopolysaccharide export system ATP-binding protein